MFHPQFYWRFRPATVLEITVSIHINYMRIIVKKHLLLFTLILFMGLASLNAQIISQYIETGSGSYPKGIEIWNNTGSTLDFATNNLVIAQGTNGAAPVDLFTVSSGTLTSGSVIVIGTNQDVSTATGFKDFVEANSAVFYAKAFTFNGDDALVVKYGGVITDEFGNPGVDPGSAWTGSGVSTANQNISLLTGITTGDVDGWTDPSTRFETTTTDNSLTGFGIAPASGSGDNPPLISGVSRNKTVPLSNEDLTVTTDITDDNLLTVTNLIYTIDGGSESTIGMTNTSGDTYSGDLPNSAYNDQSIVEYWISATDDNSQTTTGTHYKFIAGLSTISFAKTVDVNGVLTYDGLYARVTGIATVANNVYSSVYLDIYLQDLTGGIDIYSPGNAATSIVVGNSYTIVGVLDQYNGKGEIVPDNVVTDITNNGASTAIEPTIKTIAQLLLSPESYEGMLVGIQHMTKTAGTWGANASLTFTDDASVSTLSLYEDTDTDLDENVEPTWPKDIVGIFSQNDASSPYNATYQIIPRAFTDIQVDGALPVELTSFSALVQNKTVILNWQTATEVNNYGFEVERVKGFGDKVSMVSVWSKVGFVNGAGNSNSPKEYSFTDKSAASGRYLYRLKQLDNDGQYTYSKEVEVDLGTPTAFALEQNYPNPFNPTTSMQYSVSNKQFVTIKVFDMLGREVAILVNGEKEPGTYTAEFATTGLASGTYIYRMQAGEFVQTKKMVILK